MEKFLIRYPEFDKVNHDKIKMTLEDAGAVVSQRIWGKLHEQGVHALAAHYLFLNGGYAKDGLGTGNVKQTVTGKSAGGLSVSYAAPNQGIANEFGAYGETSYGQRYLELRKLVGVHVLVAK